MSGPWQDEERHWETEAGLRPPDDGVEPDEANWAVVAVLLAFSGFVFPFANIAGPLAVWLLKRDESDFVEAHARETLNFQISITIYLAVSGMLIYLLIGILLVPLVVLFDVVATIVAALRASRGELYEYPLCLRLISKSSAPAL
jgi:uncharacterized Tic20 family protein